MDSGHGKIRGNLDGDRLSILSDDLIHKILSVFDIRDVIRTSVFSSRWRYIWTSMPSLNFSSVDFYSLPEFSEFVTHVLSSRNDQIEVSSVKLTFCGNFRDAIAERILNYAFSHNVQQLNITCSSGRMIELPLFPFSSRSLKHLTLDGYTYEQSITTPPTWELPALATLNLHSVTLYDDNADTFADFFSNCVNLKNLTLKNCRLTGSNSFNIYHPGLSSLTLEDGCNRVNVVTPQLKNLTISNWQRIHLISAPNLSSLHFKDSGSGDDHDYDNDYEHDYNGYEYGYDQDDNDNDYEHAYYGYDHDHNDDDDNDDDNDIDDDNDADPLQLSTELSHLEKVDICVFRRFEDEAYAHKILGLLQRLQSVKFLTLNLELVRLISFSVEQISHQPSPFVNLKTLKFYPAYVTPYEHRLPEVNVSAEVKKYLLNGSPGATFTMVSHELPSRSELPA